MAVDRIAAENAMGIMPEPDIVPHALSDGVGPISSGISFLGAGVPLCSPENILLILTTSSNPALYTKSSPNLKIFYIIKSLILVLKYAILTPLIKNVI